MRSSYLLFVAAIFLVLPGAVIAQQERIPGKINTGQWSMLTGNIHPNARSAYDRSRADDALELNSVMLVFKPSASQQADLDRLLADLQNPTSARYHTWLTPEEYADRFGLSGSDISKIEEWAQSQQLTVTGVARGRNAVMLKGSAAQVGNAFHTEIHTYLVNGETHYANATEPSVPAAMRDTTLAVRGLHNFRMKPKTHKLTPAYTSTRSGNHYLAPDDFAAIFDIAPLYAGGINGSGQKIVIVGQSRIVSTHLSTFTTYFGMSSVSLTTKLVPNTRDPGISESDEEESDLDLQWAAAVARGASLIFVYSYDVNDAVQYAIDQNLAPVISMSYGECEESDTQSDALTLRTWAQQANTEGITWVAASGDSGAAGCYQGASGPFGSASSDLSLAADVPADIPEITAVGGTTFNEGSGTYWNSTNTSTKASAQSYIPEVAWNDSAADGEPAASGGGASKFFARPSWQTGKGVPDDGARDLPDVAFPASADHDGYMVYSTSGQQTGWYAVGGTSCGTPAFAGLLALLNQYQVSNGYQTAGGLGNVNSHLYSQAASAPSAFHDITSGNNAVEVSTCYGRRCTTESSQGYSTGTGYDQVTGLGSLDAYPFVLAWHSGSAPKSTPAIALAASPEIIATTGSTTLSAVVTSGSGTTHTGTVTFSTATETLGTATLSGSGGTATASLTLTGTAAGLISSANTITATYQGDDADNAATATVVLTVVSSSAATPSIAGLTNGASYQQSYAPGMVTAIFGSNLALTTASVSTAPLPVSLDNVSVTFNGVAAPLYYISSTQLNVQIPYETPTNGTVQVVVSNNGLTSSTSITMAPAAPGTFTDTNGAILPTSTATRGQTLTIYVSGAGALLPSVSTGSTPGSSATPVPAATTLVTVGGVQASTSYIGVPSWSVGVLQINFIVPSTVATGAQPVVVSVGGLASTAAALTVE